MRCGHGVIETNNPCLLRDISRVKDHLSQDLVGGRDEDRLSELNNLEET